MKKAGIFLALLILPAILYISASALRDVQGPYYLFFYDPSYVYLISSLNLSQLAGYGVAHFDHPGTTVQVIGAITVKIYHLLTGAGVPLFEDVLTRPESYLHLMNKVLVLINCAGLYFLGLFIRRISGDLILGLLVQLSPFVSAEIFFGLIIVTPENFLIFVCLMFIGAVWYYLISSDSGTGGSLRLLIILAVICSMGLATKISFFPLLVFPLIVIQGFRHKILFLILTLFCFFVFIIPGISNIDYFAGWLKELALKSGKYGKGEATVINSSAFVNNFLMIFKTDKIFAISFIATLAGLVSGFLRQ